MGHRPGMSVMYGYAFDNTPDWRESDWVKCLVKGEPDLSRFYLASFLDEVPNTLPREFSFDSATDPENCSGLVVGISLANAYAVYSDVIEVDYLSNDQIERVIHWGIQVGLGDLKRRPRLYVVMSYG